MMAKKKPAAKPASVPVEALKHVADRRPNIPTRETAAFAADEGPPPFVLGVPQMAGAVRANGGVPVRRSVPSGASYTVTTWLP